MFRIPRWCSLVQLASFFPSGAIAYKTADWLGIQSDVLHMALVFTAIIIVSIALGVLLAYKVPLEVIDSRCNQ